MRAKRMFMATMAAMFVMTVAFQTGSFASNGRGDSRLVAKLAPVSQTPGQEFEGRVVQRVDGIRTDFKARVEIPLSLVQPGDEDNLTVTLTVPRTAMTCTLVFDEVDTIEGVAEYKLTVRKRPGKNLNKAGNCGTGDISNIMAGDQVVVTIQELQGVALMGQFNPKR